MGSITKFALKSIQETSADYWDFLKDVPRDVAEGFNEARQRFPSANSNDNKIKANALNTSGIVFAAISSGITNTAWTSLMTALAIIVPVKDTTDYALDEWKKRRDGKNQLGNN